MAKVIRNCYVYKKNDRNYLYLPRRDDKSRQYDMKKNHAMPEDFNMPMEVEKPPKLWLVWAYQKPNNNRPWTNKNLFDLFGGMPELGKMHVFKNTADTNDKLWSVKHLIEVRPISFPNGEPTEADIGFVELHADGRCVIDQKANVDHESVKFIDESAQFTQKYLARVLRYRDRRFKDVFTDNVYSPANITIMD